MSQQNLAKLISLAFTEDRVFNDKTSDLSLAKNSQTSFAIKTREPIIFCGKDIIALALTDSKGPRSEIASFSCRYKTELA